MLIFEIAKNKHVLPQESLAPILIKTFSFFFFFIAYPAFNQYIKSVSVAHTNVCVFEKLSRVYVYCKVYILFIVQKINKNTK